MLALISRTASFIASSIVFISSSIILYPRVAPYPYGSSPNYLYSGQPRAGPQLRVDFLRVYSGKEEYIQEKLPFVGGGEEHRELRLVTVRGISVMLLIRGASIYRALAITRHCAQYSRA